MAIGIWMDVAILTLPLSLWERGRVRGSLRYPEPALSRWERA
jgi:hypothetical protein